MKNNNLSVEQHICQSPEWGEVKTKVGTPAVRVGGVQVTLHDIPLLPFKVGYCPKVDQKKIDWEQLEAVAKEHKCIFVKIEPIVETGHAPSLQRKLRPSKPIFATQTILLDLTKSEEELMAGMKSKTRYNVRLAGRKGVVVKKRNDEEGLEVFLKLQRETAERQGFFIHPDDYYRTVWEVLHPKGMAYILVASIEQSSDNHATMQPSSHSSIPLVAWLLLKYKNTFYYPYGGSLTKFRNYMPSNLMMWEAIKLGKELDCKVFDMWGATDDKNDPWYGFTRFKLGYGGEMVSFPGAYDLVLNPFLYYPFVLADRLRWWVLEFLK